MTEKSTPTAEGFGVVIGCAAGDYRYAKAAVASVRHFAPQLPICLLIDGDFSTRALRRAYDVQVLYRKQVRTDFLREKSFGFGITKMVALWESPFERFLWLDCDTVMWGDISPLLEHSLPWDVLIDRRPGPPATAADVSRFYFNIERIEQLFPDFCWQASADQYFNTGVWAARRGVFDLAEYQFLMKLHCENAGLFLYGEMGMLNFLIARNAQAGKINVKSEPLQAVVGETPVEVLIDRFGASAVLQRSATAAPIVLHYTAMRKPAFDDDAPEVRPLVDFRRIAEKTIHRRSGPLASSHLRLEDRMLSWPMVKERLSRKCSSWMRRGG